MRSAVVLVTYKPNLPRLTKALASLKNNCLDIILIDNTPENSFSHSTLTDIISNTNINYLPLEENTGIAHAQNKGISIALERRYDYIVLSDQDTVYPDNFLSNMLNELRQLQDEGKKVAAIGPAYLDENKTSKAPFFVKYGKGKLKQISQEKGTVEVSQLISSGTVITAEAMRKTGMMNADLFIDWVDLEWCWRATQAGFSIYGTFNVRIHHQLGDCSRKIASKIVTIHSPFRNYFIVRNGLHLALRGPLLDEKLHRCHLLINISLFFGGMIYLSENKIKDIKMMTRGIIDAIRGRLGPLQ